MINFHKEYFISYKKDKVNKLQGLRQAFSTSYDLDVLFFSFLECSNVNILHSSIIIILTRTYACRFRINLDVVICKLDSQSSMHINYFCMPTRRTDVRSQYKYIKKEYIKSTLFHFPTFLSHEEISAREEGSSRRSHRDIPSSFLQKKKKRFPKKPITRIPISRLCYTNFAPEFLPLFPNPRDSS